MSLLSFLLLTIALHMLAAIQLSRKRVMDFKQLDLTESGLAQIWVTLFLYILWTIEFVHAGGIPFFLILLRDTYDYKTFGIPSLHVFVVTFSSFYTIFLFHHYLSHKSARTLALYLVNLGAAVLIYNRGMFLFNVAASVSLFLIYKRTISFRHVAIGLAGAVIITFLFGAMGSLRVSNESRVAYTNEVFLKTGRATEAFRNSVLPPEFFWTYIYTTSPLANLQQNITVNEPLPITAGSVLKWLNNDLLFDFISKRVNSQMGVSKPRIVTIPGPFNATTVYSGSYSSLGWVGLFLMAAVILVIPVAYIQLVPLSSPFFLTGIATLNAIFLFMVFDNTIRFTGLSFQLVYPALLHLGVRRFGWIKKTFLY